MNPNNDSLIELDSESESDSEDIINEKDISIDLLNEFEKNGQILDSIFLEFQQSDLSIPLEESDNEDPSEAEEEQIPWLDTLSNEDLIEIENSIYYMIGEYMHDEIESLSSAHFNETMVSDIAEMLQNQLVELQLSEEKYYDEVEDFVLQISEQFFEIHLDIPPRSYKNTFVENIPLSELIRTRQSQLKYLKSVDSHKQKSKEWYEYRYNIMTASNLWKVFGSEAQQNSLICEKCKPLEFQDSSYVNVNSPLHWGNKYEPLTAMIYEDIYHTKTDDFGCIPHKQYPFIGASPDGINVDPTSQRYGRMVEIKNIFNREITGIPKEEYWIQMQIQMETCDLDECDFVETRFKEYETDEEFYLNKGVYSYSGVVLHFINKITQFENQTPQYTPKYVFMPFYIQHNKPEIDQWVKTTQFELKSQYSLYETNYWYLDEISCVLVKRNREWFQRNISKIEAFWRTIEKERITGYEHRLAKKKPAKPEVIHDMNSANTSQYIKNLSSSSQSICLIKVDENGNLL